MILYYALKQQPSGQMHMIIAIKKAYDAGMSSADYANIRGNDAKYKEFTQIMIGCGARFITNFEFQVDTPQNIIVAAGLKGFKLTLNQEIAINANKTTTNVNANLPVIYYDAEKEDGEYIVYFEFKKYYDKNIMTSEAVYNNDICTDYDSKTGKSKEYLEFDQFIEKCTGDPLEDDENLIVCTKDLSTLICNLTKKGYACVKKKLM